MSDVGKRICTNIQRPNISIVEKFRGIPVANISDSMNRLFCMHSGIKPMGQGKRLLGTAFTVKAPQGDNLLFNKALSLALPGDVIVVDACGDLNQSVCGDIMFQYAEKKGIAGFIIDGCIRDVDYLQNRDFPVYARGVTPRGPYKIGVGEINSDISCGNQVVHPGDILVGDSDGVVVIRPADAEKIYQDVLAVIEREATCDRIIAEGQWEESPAFQVFENLLKNSGYNIFD